MPKWISIESGTPDEPRGARQDAPGSPGGAGDGGAGRGLAIAAGFILLLVAAIAGGVWLAGGGQSASAPADAGPAADADATDADTAPVAWDASSGAPAAGGSAQAVGGAGPSGYSGEPELLARVNGREVTSRDVDLELAVQMAIQGQLGLAMNEDPTQLRSFRRDILDQLIDRALLYGAAESSGIAITAEEVAAGLPLLGQGLGVDGSVIHSTVTGAGIDEDHYREWVRSQLAVERYIATDDARRIGAEQMAARGLPVDPNVPLPADQQSIATGLAADAEITLYFDGEPHTPARIGEAAPDVALVDLEGRPASLSDYAGRPVVVNFWATWCGPCRFEMPILEDAYVQHGGDLVVLGIDVQEPADAVRQYIDANGLTFPMALDQEGQAATLYRVRGLPMSYFVDADGIVVDSHRGAIRSPVELEPYLAPLLGDAPEGAEPVG